MLRPDLHTGAEQRGKMSKAFLILGSVNAMLAVMLGAFGAHGLRGRLSEAMLAVYHTGVQYHFYHALGLILIGLLALHLPASGLLKAAGWVMFAGVVLFSGSLYVLALTQLRWLGMVTPVGGVAFIIAWGLLTVAVYRGL
jgi:uncharacterized membrane protein YgdD (TMEM256/DUF423 family)